MAGEFLPPVVTRLTGDISDLATEVEKAKALIKSLGDTNVTVQVKFDVNNRTLTNAIARTKALTDAVNGLTMATTTFDRAGGNTILFGGNRGGGGGGGGGGAFGLWGMNTNQLHAAAIGVAALGAAFTGAAIGAASLAAVWASGVSQIVSKAQQLNLATSATIPPGVPDYALAKAFGININPNGVFAQATQVGTGQAYSAFGGIVAALNKNNGPVASLLSNEGTSIGSGLDGLIAKMDLATSHGQLFSNFLGAVNYDAVAVGKTFANVGDVISRAFAHAPGELEWITGGLAKASGVLKDLATLNVGGVSIGGALLNVVMMYHALGAVSGLLGMGLNKIPGVDLGAFNFHSLGSNVGNIFGGITGAQAGRALTAEEAMMVAAGAGVPAEATAAAGFGMALPMTAAITALGLLGFSIANQKTPEMVRINAQNQKIQAATPMSMMATLASGVSGAGSFIAGMGQSGKIGANLAAAMANGTIGPYGGVRIPQSIYQSEQAGTAMRQWTSAEMAYQGNITAVARRMGVSPAQALLMLQTAGVKMNAKGNFANGLNAAIQQARNFQAAYGILNPAQGESLANMQIGAIVGDSAWKNASAISGNWDAYMGALAGGGQGLGNLWSVLQNVSPTVARNLAASNGTGLVPTAQALTSAGEPLADFFRQAQSVGAIGGKSFSSSIVQIAASMAPLAGSSKAAQAELVALANEGGGHFKNLADVIKAAGGSSDAALANLQNSIAGTSAKMAQMPAGFQTAASQISTNVTNMADTIIAKNGKAYTAFQKLEGSIQNTGIDSKQTAALTTALAKQLEANGMTAQQVATYFASIGLAITNIPGLKKIVIQVEGRISGNSAVVQAALASGNYSGGQLTKSYPGNAAGTPAAPPGWAWVGELGPELMHFTGGETVIPNHIATKGYAGGVGMYGSPEIHLVVELDGRQIQATVKSATYQYNVNNGNRDRQGRVAGNFRPR